MTEKENDKRQAVESNKVDRANVETERAASFRTTVPDMNMAADVGSGTDAILGSETVTHGMSSSASPHPSGDSFSGMLGRFNYVRALGEGAFGAVILVWDPELQTHRAIKVPHRDLIESGRVNADSYIAEARKLALMGRHPGIVTVLDVQRMENGTPFVVSEYVSGGSLKDRMNVGKMPWRDAVEFVAKVADAVGHAHTKGVVHRDLKPSNILLTENGEPVVVDFGMALGDNEFSYRPSVCGTYSYMSPQQIRGEADRVDGRSDVFSLGVILYQLLAGRVPYKSRDVSSLKREILQEESTPVRQYNQSVPVELEHVCQKAMAKEAKDRYSTAADFAAALRGVLAAPQGPIAKPGKSGPAWPVWLAIAAAGLAAVGFWGMFATNRPAGSGGDPAIASAAPAAGPATASFDAHVINPDGDGWLDRGSMTPKNLPLQIGDQLQFDVTSDAPRFMYVFWIDYDGMVERKWPPKNADLASQTPSKKLLNPPPAADGTPQGWTLVSRSGPEAVFAGVSEWKLEESDLHAVEAVLRDLPRRLSDGKILAHFEYPALERTPPEDEKSESIDRGSSATPQLLEGRISVEDRPLRQWFEAYRGWVFQTKE